MKLRLEPGGYHYYDRKTGIHCLLDEIIPKKSEYSYAPRTLSIAITNNCNTNCKFCHIEKGNDFISIDFIIKLCKKLDCLGTFDIAIGGGEPLTHPGLIDICKEIWTKTELGVSITTNGQLLTSDLIDNLKNYVSFIRISIDTPDNDLYSKYRQFPLKKLLNNIISLKGKIPFGINTVINNETVKQLNKIIPFAKSIGAEEILILPEIKENNFVLNKQEWLFLQNWILENFDCFPLKIIDRARGYLNIPVLFKDDAYYQDYLYLSADKILKTNSYETNGKKINISEIDRQLKNWRNESTAYNSRS